jgi:leucyl-tRNA synthetase
MGQGEGKTNYRLRDAVFSRQRYWGEPFPVYYVNGMPQMIASEHLPIKLPEVEKYLPTETGEPPLGNATVWAWDTNKNEVVSNNLIDNETIHPLELNTMPGWAGSSWYFNRYMDAHNENEFASKEALDYWQDVDLYIGGSEHATGHLLYSRFWQKFLFDKGVVPKDEYAKKLINQGMILGTSALVYIYDGGFSSKRANSERNSSKNLIISKGSLELIYKNLEFFHNLWKNNPQTDQEILKNYGIDKQTLIRLKSLYNSLLEAAKNLGFVSIDWLNGVFPIRPIHSDVSFVNASDELDIEAFKNWREEYKNAEFITEQNGTFKVKREVEKMSKSKYNVVNPDNIVSDYGADSLRLYEMFLGPLEQYKPWNTAGITGVHSFLKKLWKLYADDNGLKVTDATPTKDNLKTLHKTIKKVQEDIENFSFNTSVSTFMIAANELTAQKCTSKEILEPLLVLISPYAPHIAEELWSQLGNTGSVSTAPFPEFNASHLVESSKNYPISFNGKMRFTMELPLDLSKDAIEKAVLEHEKTQEQLAGRTPKKVIVVPGKIVNIVG